MRTRCVTHKPGRSTHVRRSTQQETLEYRTRSHRRGHVLHTQGAHISVLFLSHNSQNVLSLMYQHQSQDTPAPSAALSSLIAYTHNEKEEGGCVEEEFGETPVRTVSEALGEKAEKE